MKYQVKVVACTVLILISKKDNNINKGTRGTQRYKQQIKQPKYISHNPKPVSEHL